MPGFLVFLDSDVDDDLKSTLQKDVNDMLMEADSVWGTAVAKVEDALKEHHMKLCDGQSKLSKNRKRKCTENGEERKRCKVKKLNNSREDFTEKCENGNVECGKDVQLEGCYQNFDTEPMTGAKPDKAECEEDKECPCELCLWTNRECSDSESETLLNRVIGNSVDKRVTQSIKKLLQRKQKPLTSSPCEVSVSDGAGKGLAEKSSTKSGKKSKAGQAGCKRKKTKLGVKGKGNKTPSKSYSPPQNDQYVALDCEFVGVGPRNKSALGRCSIVDYNGNVLYDRFTKPNAAVTNYRTRWSGIRSRDLVNAIPEGEARKEIRQIIQGKIVVGHALYNDFKVLNFCHPWDHIRDTSGFRSLRQIAKLPTSCSASLKNLTFALLGKKIQKREHCSVEDARATMQVFKCVQRTWEERIVKRMEKRQKLQHSECREHNPEFFLGDRFWLDHFFETDH